MKKLSIPLLADTVVKRRKAMSLTQSQLSKLSGINRSVLSNLESRQYTPSIDQLQSLASVLGFEPTDMFIEETAVSTDTEPTRHTISQSPEPAMSVFHWPSFLPSTTTSPLSISFPRRWKR